MNIVAIGGGSVELGETESIDRELISLAQQPNPLALFIPTASSDAEDYTESFSRAYGRLGCRVDVLRLLSNDNPEKIREADLIYVGGGNTKMMLEVWRQLGVDQLLREHLDKGKPAGGLSAGALCWFRVANSDWPLYEGIPNVNTARLDCLGFVDLVLCPHTRDEGFRLAEFREMMKGESGTGVGLDDGCAIQIRGDEYRILSSIPDSVAHRIEWVKGALQERSLPPHEDFRALTNL
jgi:dipeptidase E